MTVWWGRAQVYLNLELNYITIMFEIIELYHQGNCLKLSQCQKYFCLCKNTERKRKFSFVISCFFQNVIPAALIYSTG
jgi:hypothetical protein